MSQSIPHMHAVALLAFALTTPLAAQQTAVAQSVNNGKEIKVTLGNRHVADYLGSRYAKPLIYPVIGPYGIRMTRDWPMKDGTANEAKDHPHQKSLWYTHGNVNGVDFWAEGAGKGTIAQDGAATTEAGGQPGHAHVKITSRNNWLNADGKAILTDERVVTFIDLGNEETAIDFDITLIASAGDVTFGNTKEGTMGIRTHPQLELKGKVAKGKAVNSEGVENAAVWGKQAKWVDYWAPIDGKTVGVAIFDHPKNPRHPTYWHARDYGLIAANPFGIGDFDKSKGKAAGDFPIKSGEKATFRYRFIFHKGDAKEAKIAERYEAYAK